MRGVVWFFLSILILTLLEGRNAHQQNGTGLEATHKPHVATKYGWSR